jgi:hypothetical protein
MPAGIGIKLRRSVEKREGQEAQAQQHSQSKPHQTPKEAQPLHCPWPPPRTYACASGKRCTGWPSETPPHRSAPARLHGGGQRGGDQASQSVWIRGVEWSGCRSLTTSVAPPHGHITTTCNHHTTTCCHNGVMTPAHRHSMIPPHNGAVSAGALEFQRAAQNHSTTPPQHDTTAASRHRTP